MLQQSSDCNGFFFFRFLFSFVLLCFCFVLFLFFLFFCFCCCFCFVLAVVQCAVHSCEICDNKPGSQYCTNCEQYFCSNCKLSHLKAKLCKITSLKMHNKWTRKKKHRNANVTTNCLPSIVIHVLACFAKFA